MVARGGGDRIRRCGGIGSAARLTQIAQDPRFSYRDPDLSRRTCPSRFSGAGGLSGRRTYWTVALRDASRHFFLGSGAGSYRSVWLTANPVGPVVANAHSLYLETLTDVGVVGLLALPVVILVPLAALVEARDRRMVPVAAGGLRAVSRVRRHRLGLADASGSYGGLRIARSPPDERGLTSRSVPTTNRRRYRVAFPPVRVGALDPLCSGANRTGVIICASEGIRRSSIPAASTHLSCDALRPW